MPFSITKEELAAQSLVALKVRAEELGCPLSHEDAVAVGEMMNSADAVTLPTSQAEIDEKLGQVKQMPKEAFEQMMEMVKVMEAKGAGKGSSMPFSITEEELKAQLIGVLTARAEELGVPLSDEDAVTVWEVAKQELVQNGLPTSQAQVDESLGMFKQIPKEPLEQMIQNFKMMAKGAGKGQ